MVRRKGERTAANNRREAEWFVLLPMPPLGFGMAVCHLHSRLKGLGAVNFAGGSDWRDGVDHAVFCFPDEAAARAFAEPIKPFGVLVLDYKGLHGRRKPRVGTRALEW